MDAEKEGIDAVGAPEPVFEPVPPVTVPEGEGSAVGMVVINAEGDTVTVRDIGADKDARAERDAERDAEGEPLKRALPEGDFDGALVALPVVHTEGVACTEPLPLGDPLAEGGALPLPPPLGEGVSEANADAQLEWVDDAVPFAALGLGEAVEVEDSEVEAQPDGVGVPLGEGVPIGAGVPLSAVEGEGLLVARAADALTLRDSGAVKEEDADTLGLPEGERDIDGVGEGRGLPE